jgi:hypothetical protein
MNKNKRNNKTKQGEAGIIKRIFKKINGGKMRRNLIIVIGLIIFGIGLWKTGIFSTAETIGTSPDSGVASRIKALSEVLAAKTPEAFGSTGEISGVGDWGAMWNRIYSAATWNPTNPSNPSLNATVADVADGKTFYSGTNRVMQTGQRTEESAPAPVTFTHGDDSRLNKLYEALKTVSYGLEDSSPGQWGDWGLMWNRIYSASVWTPSGANATGADVTEGKTFYAGNNRTLQTGWYPSADLTGLALSGSPGNYTFSATTYTYNGVTVLNAVTGITVTPSGAGTITVDGTTVTSGQPSGNISLNAGSERIIPVVVTEAGKKAKTYTIKITRNNSALTSPTFDPNTGAIALGVTAITLSSDAGTTIYYTTNGTTPTTGSSSVASGGTITLASVANPIKAIAVKANYDNSSMGTSGTYTQAESALTGMVISDTPGNYTFASGTYEYPLVTSLNAVAHIHITPTSVSGTITVDGVTVVSGASSGEITLTAGTEKTIPVIVTETGKSSKTYTIKVTRIPAIGGTLQGGKVAYIDGTGLHGIIAATADQGSSTYGCYGTYVSGGTGTGIGTGHTNTQNMINTGCTGAAQLCHGVEINGYSDWYLPSQNELAQLYANRGAIGGFASAYYWSSSEYSNNNAWKQVFSTGYQIDHGKYTTTNVRAIRGF